MSRVKNNWRFILRKRREFLDAVKRAVEISDLTTPRRITSYVIDHKDQAVTGALDSSEEGSLIITRPVSPREAVLSEDTASEYLTVDETGNSSDDTD